MNITKLIAAAEEIDRLADKQQARTRAFQQLAIDARKPDADREDILRRKQALDVTQVVDFGTAIADLRAALKAKA